ncbi:glycine hydroxymethyltransferase [Granulicatella balaenopterae]|uniref:Serine hydroxymethyltransferase n=1 Tax=Granulicatella balaenopterae TaxID=137733 RepID=A0A1H9NYF6_9LACT|nr:serine hydroxymethyltransferase [Granulicatella balaenopterae]SER41064.1 glycine hydroxymethyltransferase [Granulicatella balaenopterae]
MVRDEAVFQAIEQEFHRQQDGIELIASENFVSKQVLEAQGSVLTNKYAEGYPGRRYYGGCEYIDVIENLAIDRVKELFGAEYANVQPHSGSQANMAAYRALINKGDKVLGMDLNHGGHLTHGLGVNFSGKDYDFVCYGLNQATEMIDYDALEDLALKEQPALIVAGASAYAREIDFKRMKEIADKCGAKLMVDMAHIAGLVAKGYHQSPIPYADVVTSTTHKTLRGPRGGLILAKAEYAKKLNSAIFPGIQGGPLEHVIAAKAVAFHEALSPEFADYIKQVVLNAKAMEKVFVESNIRPISGGTDNHLLLLDVTKTGMNGKEVQDLLDTVNITVNKNAIPFDTLPPTKTSGIRIGTPAITTRGFDEKAAAKVAELIVKAIKHHEDEAALANIRQEVSQLVAQFPLYQ